MYQRWYNIFVYFLVHYCLTNPLPSCILIGTKGGVAMPVSYDKLFALMKERGIKKIDLRNTYKLNPKTVDSLAKNKSVTVDTIMQLCEIFDCQPADLMEYVKAESPKAE